MITLPLNETSHTFTAVPNFNGTPFQADGVTPAAFDPKNPIIWAVAGTDATVDSLTGLLTVSPTAAFVNDPASIDQDKVEVVVTATADGDLSAGDLLVSGSETIVFTRTAVITPVIGANGLTIVA